MIWILAIFCALAILLIWQQAKRVPDSLALASIFSPLYHQAAFATIAEPAKPTITLSQSKEKESASQPASGSIRNQIDAELIRLHAIIKELENRHDRLMLQKTATEEALSLIEQDNYRKTRELLEARQLQLAMLPIDTPFYPNYEIRMQSLPATEVGGDYYDYRFSKRGDLLQLILADATGHGFKAGVLVAITRSYFQMMPNASLTENFFNQLSRAIRSLQVKSFYMGVSGMRLQDDLAILEGVGMPPVLYYNAAKRTASMLYQRGMYLGIMPQPKINRKAIRLHSGDALLMLTDGLAEVHNNEGEMLGYEAVCEGFQEVMRSGKKRVVDEMLKLANDWRKDTDQSDDITLIFIRRK